MAAENENFNASVTDGVLRLRMTCARLDASTADAFRAAFRPLVAQAHSAIVDLSAAQFLDSVGLGALVSLQKSLGSKTRLRIHAPAANVRMLFEVTRLDQVFEVLAAPADPA